MKKTVFALAAACIALGAAAKLPPVDEAAKAKAAETSAKAAWQAKLDGYQLCKAQDKVAAKYAKGGAKAVPVTARPAATAAAPASAASAVTGATTPVASVPITPCSDPGPFAYNAPQEKPLETSAAHSPAGTAASPPSVRPEAAQIQPSGKTAKQ
jgi:hypothetical protein